MPKATGVIVKGIAGFYYVYVGGAGIYECRARGIFRKEKIKPLVGDEVLIDTEDAGDMSGNVARILPRRSALERPAVANADQALVIFASSTPRWSERLLDKVLIRLEAGGVTPVIVFNKADEEPAGFREEIQSIYAPAGYRLFFVSAKSGSGTDELAEAIKGKTSVLTGPSGVGKSTLVNRLVKYFGADDFLMRENIRVPANMDMFMETGGLSGRLGRGKNTTRHAQWIPLDSETFVFDTPGFSAAELEGVTKESLASYYPEFVKYEPGCRFAGCSHITEPDCGVKDALGRGLISEERYNIYKEFYGSL